MPRLPIRAGMICPSGGGKTTLISNFILNNDFYRGCWEAFFIVSPSVNVDHAWAPVRQYIEETLGQEDAMWDHYEETALSEFIGSHTAIVKQQKKRGAKKIFGALVVLDDVTDQGVLRHARGPVAHLATRGRHACISLITSSQVWRALHPVIRINLNLLCLWAQFNRKELEALSEEVSAFVSPEHFQTMLNTAVIDQPYSFLSIDFQALRGSFDKVFKIRFDKAFTIHGSTT